VRIPLVVAVTASLLVLPTSPGAAGAQESGQGTMPSGTDAVVVDRSPDSAPRVVGLDAAAHDGFDRVVLQLDGPLPGYRVEYVDTVREPAPNDATVSLEGEAALQVTLGPAVGQDDGGLTFAPDSVRPQLRSVREVTYAGDGEGGSVFGIGVSQQRPFRVVDLQDPPRVVVDVAQPRSSAVSTTTAPRDFRDVDGSVHETAIKALAAEGISRGCNQAGDLFCPAEPVVRGQMAAFLVRALELPPSDTDAFGDDGDSVHEQDINALAAAGITQGCTADSFCPASPVTRGQMASFLLRGFSLQPVSDDFFADDGHSPHHGAINGLAAAGITAGCDDLQSRFCPGAQVSRAQMATFLARALDLVPRTSPSVLLRPGDESPRVAALQRQLAQLRYWVGPVDGVYGNLTEQAVTAFQKAHGLSRDGVYGPATREAMTQPRPVGSRSSKGLVLEVDEARQLLLMVRDGEVQSIFNTSTGTEQPYTHAGRRYLADTPNGRWEVYRQIDGWRESHLGRLYRPKYFHTDGIAIHGYPNVPPYPASHGCVRVSMQAMDFLWPRLPIGTPVWVY
jgi:hypothetical protein